MEGAMNTALKNKARDLSLLLLLLLTT